MKDRIDTLLWHESLREIENFSSIFKVQAINELQGNANFQQVNWHRLLQSGVVMIQRHPTNLRKFRYR